MALEVVSPTQGEMIWNNANRLIMLNPLMMPAYYSTLFMVFRNLLNEEDFAELNAKVKAIEDWISDDLNPLTLHEAEIRMYNNMDLLSGFEVRGQLITQYDINARLEQIKQYLIQKLYEYQAYVRFTQIIRM